jgi:hypothetical protein
MSPALLRASQPPLETLTIFRGACALLSVTSHPPLYVHLNCVFMCRYLTHIVVTMNKHVWVIDSQTSARNNTEKQIYSDQILRTKTVGLFETSVPDYKLSWPTRLRYGSFRSVCWKRNCPILYPLRYNNK